MGITQEDFNLFWQGAWDGFALALSLWLAAAGAMVALRIIQKGKS